MRKLKIMMAVLVAVIMAVALFGCAPPGPAPTVTPTLKPAVTPTSTPTPTASPTATPKATPTPTEKLPAVIGLTTFGSGTKGYVLHTGMGHAVEVKTGMKVRVVPGGTNKARAMAVINGECVVGAHLENAFYTEQSGIWDFLQEGPQKLSMVWMGAPGSTTFFCRADSGIKTFADIKGKKVVESKTYDMADYMNVTAFLAFGGLTWKDVIPTPIAYAQSKTAVIEGGLDVGTATPAADYAYQLAASLHGAYLFQFPATDTEGWKRLRQHAPWFGPGKIAIGVNASEQNPLEVAVFPYAFFSRADANEGVIYAIVKAFIQGFDMYKDVHPEAKLWNLESALNMDMLNASGLAYHPGAVRALKETGKWTARHDKWQQSRLEFAEKITKAYAAAVDEATAKKISLGSADFEALWFPRWQQMRVELVQTLY